MKLVILAAGEHKRLPDLSHPKALIKFGDLTITQMVIREFARAGVDEVGICVGHQAKMIEEHIGDRYCGVPVSYFYNENYATTGAAASLACAAPFFRGRNCVIMEGDHLLHPSLPGMLVNHDCTNAIMGEHGVPEYGEETVLLSDCKHVTGIVWPASSLENRYRVYGEAVVMVKLSRAASAVLAMMLGDGEIIAPLHILLGSLFYSEVVDTNKLPWIEIDTPDDLERAGAVYDQILNGETK